MKKLAIFGGIIVVVFALIIVLTNQANKSKLADSPYDKTDLKQSTIDLISDENYQNIIMPDQLKAKIDSGEPVTAYFFSPECVHCQELTPRLTPLAKENDIEIVKYNVLEYEQGWDDYLLEATPTLVYFKDGKEVSRMVGSEPNETIQAFFDEVVLN